MCSSVEHGVIRRQVCLMDTARPIADEGADKVREVVLEIRMKKSGLKSIDHNWNLVHLIKIDNILSNLIFVQVH